MAYRLLVAYCCAASASQDMKAWCQMPDTKTKLDLAPSDLDNLTKSIRAKFPRVTVELPEPSAFVLVGLVYYLRHIHI